MQNKFLNVLYAGRQVGRVAETPDKLLAFEYDAEWLRDGFSISPFKLPLKKRVFVAERAPFDENFGVFNDSLPDGWGRLLLDRMLKKNAYDPATLDRLAIVGTSGMGALEFTPAENFNLDESESDFDVLAKESAKILDDAVELKIDLLDELFANGGSSGGARPKIFRKIDGADWMVKFRAGIDPKNIGQQEFDYMEAAKNAGLIVPKHRLFKGKYFGVKRFDRTADGKKIFMISAGGLLNASHRMPALDYNDLMTITLKLTRDYREVEKMFRQMCFNVFAHNRDDHAKNFSFLYDNGVWSLSPAYDLVYSAGMGGEHATGIDGEGRHPTIANILSTANKAGINPNRAAEIIAKVQEAILASGLLKKYIK